jgi:hypothetical protein
MIVLGHFDGTLGRWSVEGTGRRGEKLEKTLESGEMKSNLFKDAIHKYITPPIINNKKEKAS